MKAIAKLLVLMMALSVMATAAVSAAEDIPPEGSDTPATADFENDAEMTQYSIDNVLGNLYVSDATSTYIGNIENSPALQADANLVNATAELDDDDGGDEANDDDDETAQYEGTTAINDQPDTGRVSTALPVIGALALLAAVPVINRKK